LAHGTDQHRLDDDACRTVMESYRLSTKPAAINFALRTLAVEPPGVDAARRLRGFGWDGALDEMREFSAPPVDQGDRPS
jgi:Arc/MetJ family transcription regulator